MICIWSTSVRLTWGVASLRSIILNMHVWASRVLKPKIQAGVYQVSRRLKSATPRASLFVSTDSPNNRLRASGFRGQPATSSSSRYNIENSQADIIDLTKAFGSSRITDALERPKGYDHYFDRKGKLRKGVNLFSGSAHVSTGGLFGNVSRASTDTGLFGSAPHATTNTDLFGSSPHANKNTFWGSSHVKTNLFGSSSHANTNTGLFGSSLHTNTGKSSLGEPAYPNTSKGLFGGSPRHNSPNRRPFGSNAKADDDSNHDGLWKRPASKAKGTSRLRSLGTTGVAFSSYQEGNDDYQSITSQWPFQKYSLEELRLDDYDKGHRYHGSSVGKGDNDQRVDTDGVRSEEDSNFNPDDDTCDHSQSDDCSCSTRDPTLTLSIGILEPAIVITGTS